MTTFIKQIKNVNGSVDFTYSDINIDYGSDPDTTVLDIDALTQKILLVLSTPIRSRKWRPNFGCRLYRRLHDPFDSVTAGWMGVDAKQALESIYNGLTQDVTNVKVTVVPDATTQTYWTSIQWTAPKLKTTGSVQFNIDPGAL